ncbi:hypothetical protein RYX36_012925, partial [Vicia faba]
SLAWDPTKQHFLVGSLRHRTISSISDTGIIETLISDTSLPERHRRRHNRRFTQQPRPRRNPRRQASPSFQRPRRIRPQIRKPYLPLRPILRE